MPSADSAASPATTSSSANTTLPSLFQLLTALVGLAAAYLLHTFLTSSSPTTPASTPDLDKMVTAPASTVAASAATNVLRAPVYFVSHGGPPTLFDVEHPAYKQWVKTGKAIQAIHASRPGGLKGIVILSAHWESDNDKILVNTNHTDLIYDFGGFPAHYYKQTFKHEWLDAKGIADVTSALSAAGVKWEAVKNRGLDHGAWVPGKVMFPESAPPPAPLLQISLPRPVLSQQLEGSFALGRALAPLREQGYLILGSGQPVHNLRDYMYGSSAAYGKGFLKRTCDWVNSSVGSVEELKEVRKWLDYKRAVPADDHFAPLVAALGAGTAFGSTGKVDMSLDEGPLGWGFFNWD